LDGISGVYLEDCCVTKSSRNSFDKKMQEQLWKTTWDLLKKWTGDASFELPADNPTNKV
jgi:hypothetical protein